MVNEQPKRSRRLITVFLAVALAAAGSLPAQQAGSEHRLAPVVLSTGWPIRAFDLNNNGTVVFAGGQNPFFADGLVIASEDRFVKFGAMGDPVPGYPGQYFVGFDTSGSTPSGPTGHSINDRDQVAFTAWFMACSAASFDVWQCFGKSIPSYQGLFLRSAEGIRAITVTGDPAPESGGLKFYGFGRVWLNNRGSILFEANVGRLDPETGWTVVRGLFLHSASGAGKVALQGEGSAIEVYFTTAIPVVRFDDDDGVTFRGDLRFIDGRFTRVVGSGGPAPGGGVIGDIFEVSTNAQGDVAFQARFGPTFSDEGLFLRRRNGTLARILAHGEPTAVGGKFNLFFETTDRFGRKQEGNPISLSPKLDTDGDVVFTAPIADGPATAALFRYRRGELAAVVVPGDPLQDDPEKRFSFGWGPPGTRVGLPFEVNARGDIAFWSGVTGGSDSLFKSIDGRIVRVASFGDEAPGADGATFAGGRLLLLLNDSGEVAFQANVSAGRFSEGLFLATPAAPAVPNGDFEARGDSGLPIGWETTWSNSGAGEVFQASGDAFRGDHALRLAVPADGGSAFVLSDPIPVLPEREYVVTGRMRYLIQSSSDEVYLSVIQFDSAGMEVGFDELRPGAGESLWTWARERLLVRTAKTTRSIRIRFGLIARTESYMDVDDVH